MHQAGEVGILNVGAGDTKLSFDPANPKERERAARIVTDMIRRGFTILIQVGVQDGEPLYQRAKGFKEDTCEYLIAGDPGELDDGKTGEAEPRKAGGSRKGSRNGPYQKRVAASGTRAVAVGRTAGG